MESKNKLTMCRLCLCQNECFINIFELNDWQGYVAADVIYDLLRFQVFETDGYPHVVCSTCLTRLTEFKLFKECCQQSKVTYDKMSVSSESFTDRRPKTVEFATVKAEPIYYSEQRNISKASDDSDGAEREDYEDGRLEDVGCDVSGFEQCEEDPLGESSSDVETILSGPSGNSGTVQSTAKLKDSPKVSYGLILLKLLPGHKESHPQGNLIESKALKGVGALKPSDKSMEDSIKVETIESGSSGSSGTVQSTAKLMKDSSKPYSCKVCHARFAQRFGLARHRQDHHGSRVHKCDVCAKDFTQSYHLKRHLLVHAEEKPHECVHCGRRFRQRGGLTRHLKDVCEWNC